MPKKQGIAWNFPIRGLHKGAPYSAQPKLTTPDAQNVRAYDVIAERARGGQRPGIKKFSDGDQFDGVSSATLIQRIHSGVVSVSTEAAFARRLILIVVSSGAVHAGPTFTSLVEVDDGGQAESLSATSTDVRCVTANNGSGVKYVWFVDGTNYAKLNIQTNNPMSGADFTAWTAATAGTIPANSTNLARLICVWRNRIVMSGIEGDDHNWFMSRVGDPEDWDYSPTTPDGLEAVAGNNADAGELGDICTALIPFNDDYLIMGGDRSMWIMRGDPLAGGQIDRICDGIGCAWGDAWAKNPNGDVYFWGTFGGVYRINAGVFATPELMSRYRLDKEFGAIDLSTHRIRMQWDVDRQGLWVFITPLTQATTAHYFWDEKTDSWWKDVIPASHGPTAVYTLDGDAPTDRVMLMGGFDGYLRQFDEATENDDGTAIDSYVTYPPVVLDDYTDMRLTRLTFTTAQSNDAVEYEVRTADNAEEAISATAAFTGSVTGGGRQEDIRTRARGKAIALRIGNNNSGQTFAVERISGEATPAGLTRA